jgi:hypothetical protein
MSRYGVQAYRRKIKKLRFGGILGDRWGLLAWRSGSLFSGAKIETPLHQRDT